MVDVHEEEGESPALLGLSNDILGTIMLHLKPRDICALGLACRRLQDAACDEMRVR